MLYRAIIVAGGKGTRMGADVPKQYMLINGKPCFQHAIESFLCCGLEIEITMVIAKGALPFITNEGRAFLRTNKIKLVEGGAERYASVINGLNSFDNGDYIVAIHDAARPLVSPKVVKSCFLAAKSGKGAVAACPTTDTVRYHDGSSNTVLPRKNVYLVYTPQCFVAHELKAAYAELSDYSDITDDAGVYERYGYSIELIPDSRYNIKITTSEDLEVVTQIIKKPLGI